MRGGRIDLLQFPRFLGADTAQARYLAEQVAPACGCGEYDNLAQNLLRPERPFLAEALRIATEILVSHVDCALRVKPRTLTDGELSAIAVRPEIVHEVCEALSARLPGEVPAMALTRKFLPFRVLRDVSHVPPGLTSSSEEPVDAQCDPTHIEQAVAFAAADQQRLAQAEALALEAARRLQPFGLGRVERVAWIMARPTSPLGEGLSEGRTIWGRHLYPVTLNRMPGSVFRTTIDPAIQSIWRFLKRDENGTEVERDVQHAMGLESYYGHRRWVCAFAAQVAGARWLHDFGIQTSSPYAAQRRLWVSEATASAPNPFTPLLDIMRLGYMPVDIRGQTVILAMPLTFPLVGQRSIHTLRKAMSAEVGAARKPPRTKRGHAGTPELALR